MDEYEVSITLRVLILHNVENVCCFYSNPVFVEVISLQRNEVQENNKKIILIRGLAVPVIVGTPYVNMVALQLVNSILPLYKCAHIFR